VLLFEPLSSELIRREVLRRLSHAASGKLLTVKKTFDPTEPDLDGMPADGRLTCHPGALALAVVEARTGVRPSAELFNYSLPPRILSDPDCPL
jgi:hypothetical protein